MFEGLAVNLLSASAALTTTAGSRSCTGDCPNLGFGRRTHWVGDQMSHYNPTFRPLKTGIEHLIGFVAATGDLGPNTVLDPL